MKIATIEELRRKADRSEKVALEIINDLERTISEKLAEANTELSKILVGIEASTESRAVIGAVELLQVQSLGDRHARTVAVKIILNI